MRRAILASSGLAAAAVALALLTLLPVRTTIVCAGHLGDDCRWDGLGAVTEFAGETARWTRGNARLTLGPLRGAAVLHLRAAPRDAGASIHAKVSGSSPQRFDIGPGWTDISVALLPRLRTAVTFNVEQARGAANRTAGLFVSQTALETGGPRRLSSTPGATIGALATLLLAPMAGIVLLARRSRLHEGVGWCGALAVGVLGALLLVALRSQANVHLGAAIAAAWGAVVVIGVLERRASGASSGDERIAVVLFAVAGLVGLGILFFESWRNGFVLSQADLLFDREPWRSHIPAGHRAVARAPLLDVPMLVYPFLVHTIESIKAFEFPAWTSRMGAGQPFLAAYQTALFSPFTWMALVIAPPGATVVMAAARLVVGGVGMWAFLRALGLSRWAAAFGGLAYFLSPFCLAWMEYPLSGVPPWLPWMLFFAKRAALQRGLHLALLSVTTALVLAGGHPHTALFAVMLGAAYAMTETWLTRRQPAAVVVAAAAVMLGTLLAMVQVVPFLEYLWASRGYLERSGGAAAGTYTPPLSTLATALVPNVFGHPGSQNYQGPSNYIEQLAYLGTATWLLAPLGVLRAVRDRDRRVVFFAIAALLAISIMYGAPILHDIVTRLPLVGAATRARLLLVITASMIVVAACGWDAVLRAATSRERVETITVVAATAVVSFSVLAVALAANEPLASRSAAVRAYAADWLALACGLAVAIAAVVAARLLFSMSRAGSTLLLVSIVILDLLAFGRNLHPLVPAQDVYPRLPEVDLVRADGDRFRVIGVGTALTPNAALVYGLEDVRAYDGLGVARYADLLDAAFPYRNLFHQPDRVDGSALLNLLNVKYVFGLRGRELPADWFTRLPGDAPVYRNERVLPRAFLVDGYLVMDGNAARRALRDGRFDFVRQTLVEGDLPPGDRPEPAANPADVGTASIRRYTAAAVDIETTAPGRRLLVLTDVAYPGWAAFLDGREVPWHRANYAFRAVSVPPGRHLVRFAYLPWSLRLGAFLSILAAAGIALLWFRHRDSARRVPVPDRHAGTPGPNR